MSRPAAFLLCVLLATTGCLGGGPPDDVPYGRGGYVEGEVVPNEDAPNPIPFDSPAVQSDDHVRQAVIDAVESPDGSSHVTFEAGEGKSPYGAWQRLHEADGTFVEHGYAVSYRNRTVVVRVLFAS